MSDVNRWGGEKSIQHAGSAAKDFARVANELCEKALDDAKAQLHPLLRSVEVERLDQRGEFLEAFKSALEKRIAHRLAIWQPSVQAVFRFNQTPMENMSHWDGSIHLLVKVPRLSNTMKTLGKTLDKALVKYLKQLGWSRFQTLRSILEVQQVTPNELRHGISYGAMFCAVYTVPVKVWP